MQDWADLFDWMGSASGRAPGSASGPAPGSASGPAPGSASGPAPGSASGPACGPASGPASSPAPSLASSLTFGDSLPIDMISKDVWENYIHGLSQIEFHRGSGRDLPAWSRATPSDREHVTNLDGLALLLVFQSIKDVAAVSYWQSKDELKVLWAKNEPVDDASQLRYIEDLLENAKKGTPATELVKTVISMCRAKIFHRIKKLAKSFDVSQTDQKLEESNLWQFDETKEPHQKLEAALKKANLVQKYDSTVDLLDRFTRFVGKVTKASEVEDFRSILYFSKYVTSVAGLDEILEGNQVKYLKKLGDYVRILERLPAIVRKAGTREITVEQVRPPAAEPTEVLSGSLDVLNLRGGQIVSDEILEIENWAQVKDAYPGANPGDPATGKRIINFTQHCEITLALDMLNRTQPKLIRSRIEIGVSKACCEWCCDYLKLLRSAGPILVRASHGKQPDGWMMPPNGPKRLEQRMAQSIEEKFDDALWKIKGRRLSDSTELSPFGTKADAEDDIAEVIGYFQR